MPRGPSSPSSRRSIIPALVLLAICAFVLLRFSSHPPAPTVVVGSSIQPSTSHSSQHESQSSYGTAQPSADIVTPPKSYDISDLNIRPGISIAHPAAEKTPIASPFPEPEPQHIPPGADTAGPVKALQPSPTASSTLIQISPVPTRTQSLSATSPISSPELSTPLPSVSSHNKSSYLRLDWDSLQSKILDFVRWDRPNTEHWPAWHDYDSTDYDPNRWEGMARETGYFTENTVPQLKQKGAKSQIYLPYPDYNSKKWRKQWKGEYLPCAGPRGQGYAENVDHILRAYSSTANSFPEASIGSASVLGLDQSVCFDRESRYGPYGLRRLDESERHKQNPRHLKNLDWDYSGWGRLQDACFDTNQNRYRPGARVPMVLQPTKYMRQEGRMPISNENSNSAAKFHSRTAVLIRTWEGYKYRENDLQALRALITELSLLSGGEYQVYLLVNVKQREADIYEDPYVYQEILSQVVPAEFRDIAVLWTERVLEDWYPKVGDWQVYWMQFMPVQWFSKTHPEFDYIWNWETDARYIGNHYHFLEQISAFAKNMPRKHLWERNSRFYIPEQHGSWENFLNDTDEAILQAREEGILRPVWGPEPYAPFQFPTGPEPPHHQDEDNFAWGVGEEADLITLQPIWDPAQTGWSYRNHIWNFIPTVRPEFTPENGNGDGIDHPGFPTIPRRTFINTQVRLSKRLLDAMHLENLDGRSMQAEMWPATVALHHGLKAVYAPHPIWTDRKWPAWYMDAVFNADSNQSARWGQQADSPYNHDREANFGGWSWYFRSVFPHVLYRRWLGWKAHDFGWDAARAAREEWDRVVELGLKDEAPTTVADMMGGERVDIAGRMCLPGMLLHPVKDVRESADGG